MSSVVLGVMGMQIIVNELKQSPGQRMRLTGPFNASGTDLPQTTLRGFAFDGWARADGEITRVQGEISGLIHTDCARCASPVKYSFQALFDERFSDRLQDNDEDSEILPYESGKIELTPYFKQTILLEAPTIYICSKECKGLCPSCGINWNEQTCDCDNERIDPRLADLALFFQKDQKK